MMIAKQGIIITHAIALTALLIIAMGWQAQVQKKSGQTSLTGLAEPSFFEAGVSIAQAFGPSL